MDFNEKLKAGKEKLKRFAKKQIKQAIKKFIKKILKALLKKLILAIAKAIAAAVAWLVGILGVPIAIILGIVLIIGGAMFILAPNLGLVDDQAKQQEMRQELQTLIKESSKEPNYRPPFELVASIDMMRIIQEDKEPEDVNYKPIVDTLTPEFTYESYDDTYEIKTVTTTTTEVTKEETKTETYTVREQVGTKREFICDEEEASVMPWNLVEIRCWKQVPVYEDVVKTKTGLHPVTETVTEVDEEVKEEKKEVSHLKTAHAWNKFETFYYKEVELKTEFELVSTKQEGNKKIEIYKRKTKEWVFDHKDFEYNYTKFDQVLTDLALEESAIQLLVESLKENNIPLDGYMGTFFDTFLEGGAGMMVPAEYLKYYQAAEKKYGVKWNYLAAIHYVETKFSSIEIMVSTVGAVGHMQFMPCTWLGWAHDSCSGKGKGNIPMSDLTNPSLIKKYRGLGQDAQGDGKSDPWDLEDAIYSAANLLSRNGFASDPKGAIYSYNKSQKYVADVVHYAELFSATAGGIPPITDGTFMRPTLGPITSNFGYRIHPITKKRKLHQGVDIGKSGSVTPIVAAATGVVSRSEVSSSFGEVVYIKHTIDGEVWETVYAHMVTGSRRVKKGDLVEKGQVLGLMGMTGGATGVHLHFEVWPGGRGSGKPIDPVASGIIKW
ncbi:hypothetical protein EKG37_17665 [Robertmurraya yapensis]|uniref:Peptidase M23 domain-containing protein n=2 Tax=Bacillaceae TaxID=186817 RepID=A0A3S0INP3_9BACI|nr:MULTISPECIES: peptidoglycan DD-metalloendopeptidase family protein [Bacillaceae]RTR28129.1 hypothetical protein EKG37_17665 [Bacillus yapensis]TKC15149.1 hypothetical protein FA727_19900 [Robertmurraya kyonggiensis]TKS94372.1 hypothetical protein FAR12_17670 [Bacillus yapensis]